MDLKTADRLARLRKEHGYSQEELADELFVSRQAVSKWERAESSPDTDNLVALARLYRVSLDELLGLEPSWENKQRRRSEERVANDRVAESANFDGTRESSGKNSGGTRKEYDGTQNARGAESAGGQDGQREHSEDTRFEKASADDFRDGERTENASWYHKGGCGDDTWTGESGFNKSTDWKDGFGKSKGDDEKNKSFESSTAEGSRIYIGSEGILLDDGEGSRIKISPFKIDIDDKGQTKHFNSEEFKKEFVKRKPTKQDIVIEIFSGVFLLLTIAGFFTWGFLAPNGWRLSWLLWVFFPAEITFVNAVVKRKWSEFAFPVLVAGVFLTIGMTLGIWHPTWVVFLSIPPYYIFGELLQKLCAYRKEQIISK